MARLNFWRNSEASAADSPARIADRDPSEADPAEALDGADLVIEATVEDEAVKKAVYAEVVPHLSAGALTLLAGVETVGEAVSDPAGARFLDLDSLVDESSPLPSTMPSAAKVAERLRAQGVAADGAELRRIPHEVELGQRLRARLGRP